MCIRLSDAITFLTALDGMWSKNGRKAQIIDVFPFWSSLIQGKKNEKKTTTE